MDMRDIDQTYFIYLEGRGRGGGGGGHAVLTEPRVITLGMMSVINAELVYLPSTLCKSNSLANTCKINMSCSV